MEEDNSKLPKGQSSERDGAGRPTNMPGIYRHEAAGKEIITVADPNDGSIQADALVRVGYRRVGDVPSRQELQKMQQEQLKKDLAGKTDETVATTVVPNGTTTRSTTELEAENAELKKTLEAVKVGQKVK